MGALPPSLFENLLNKGAFFETFSEDFISSCPPPQSNFKILKRALGIHTRLVNTLGELIHQLYFFWAYVELLLGVIYHLLLNSY